MGLRKRLMKTELVVRRRRRKAGRGKRRTLCFLGDAQREGKGWRGRGRHPALSRIRGSMLVHGTITVRSKS